MAALLLDPSLQEKNLRHALYAGDTVLFSARQSSKALCELAWELIQEAFSPVDPEQAQLELPVEQFVEIISALKPRFTHHPRAKELLRDLFEEVGCDPAEVYFDVPKLRIVTHSGYLESGMGYVYKAHRDIWYACPPCQINWWTPIRDVDERRVMVIHPRYFGKSVPNNSEQFDAYKWNAEGRKLAATYISEDPRPHPHLKDNLDLDRQVVVGEPGSLMLFSAQHLHATVPNSSGKTRFSIDFRTVAREDVVGHKGAKVVDSRATGTTLRDFLRSTDHERFSDDVVASYETGERPEGGVEIFDPK